ncbi:hypothetical protein ACTI_25540 [Actinoplanes sp. OR16]|uniref:DUF4142 domain-containing protein n=1 Tax=Actinoplanes sp. OR16 TaxID=946334 RepID=UPI000F71D8D5|nr:DUF4142 domain-containing protein [Actinoplanes sp. OR16]BBH65869.1 hypothetical protein ACTI_25540 [Actinoplanes sp. OR16]
MPLRRFFAVISALVLIGTGSPAHARPVSPDADFLIAAHQGNLAEIAAGKLARRKGDTAAVRRLGRRLAAYHRKLDSVVQKTAIDLDVTLPDQPNSEQQTLVHRYEAASGAEFDTLFVGSQLIAHEHAVKLARVVLDTGTEPRVSKIVTRALPMIQNHQRELLEAQQKLTER